MNAGPYDREDLTAYVQACKEAVIASKGTPEEQELLRSLYHKASELAGKEWNEYSSRKTTDEGIEESARLMCKYRILLAEIRHREERTDGRRISETRKP